jgi:hypothetical protein
MMTQASFSGWNFSSPWNIVEGISYPYLAWQFSGTPQIISGKVNVTGAGKIIQTAVNGSLLAAVSTGANGFYYFALPGNSVASGSALLAYISGDTVKSASVYLSSGTHITDLSLNSNTVTAGGATISTTTLGTAKGALDSPDIPYTYSGNNVTLNSGFNLAMNADGDITLDGLVDAGTGNVTLISGGAIINGMGSATSIIAASLAAEAMTGIGSGSALTTGVNRLAALNTTANNIEIDNTGVVTVSDLRNLGTGNVIFENTGAITTETSRVTSSGGSVSLTANSPLTIGAGGVSAYSSISLVAAPSAGGGDNLTINGAIASSNGSIILSAGSSIVMGPGGSLSAPNGTVTLNGASTGTDNLATVGNNTATDNTLSSLITAMGTITSDESGDDEDELKKKNKEGGDQKTDEKKLDDDKKYCN